MAMLADGGWTLAVAAAAWKSKRFCHFLTLCETLCMARVHFSADCLAAGDPASGGSFKGQLNRQSGKGASPTEVS